MIEKQEQFENSIGNRIYFFFISNWKRDFKHETYHHK
jgi:hypothetical protein